MGMPVIEGYGLTETASSATANDPADFRIGTVGRPVEESHDALHHQEIGSGRGPAGQGADGVETAQPGVEVAGRTSAGEGVVAGIDEVRAHLRRRDPIAAPAQGGHQPRGDGRLADA